MAKESKSTPPAQQPPQPTEETPAMLVVTNTYRMKVEIQKQDDTGFIEVVQLSPGETTELADTQFHRSCLEWYAQRSMILITSKQ